MKEISLSDMEKGDLLQRHKCPGCGSYDIIFYNPNLMDQNRIQIEVECQNCPCYTIVIAKLEIFHSNKQFKSHGRSHGK